MLLAHLNSPKSYALVKRRLKNPCPWNRYLISSPKNQVDQEKIINIEASTSRPSNTRTSEVVSDTSNSTNRSLKSIFLSLHSNFNNNKYPIKSIGNFALFVDMCHKEANIPKILKEFTLDSKGVIQVFEENYLLIDDRAIKIRFTKILNKLRESPTVNINQ